jgi:transposase
MTKSFRPWKVDEVWLLPPSVQEFVPEGHAAHLVREIVAEELDLAAILSAYTEPRGYPPHHPAMMVALLLYAYSRGLYSSRRIARACEERLDFQAVTALNRPDFRTISEFHRRHLAALAELVVQVLALCRRAGLVGLGHVAVDGTKLRANASKHKAMSHARMRPAEAELAAEVEGWLAQAEGADAAEDAALGADRRGDEMPAWMRGKQRRLQRIRAAKAELETEARAAEAARPDPGCKADGSPRGRRGRQRKHPPGVPKPAAQRNFTDPESRIMKGRDGFGRSRDRWRVHGRALPGGHRAPRGPNSLPWFRRRPTRCLRPAGEGCGADRRRHRLGVGRRQRRASGLSASPPRRLDCRWSRAEGRQRPAPGTDRRARAAHPRPVRAGHGRDRRGGAAPEVRPRRYRGDP